LSEILSSALANAEAFAQQQDLLQRLRALDELKTVFLATASHELRTPVSAISGFARLLADRITVLKPEQIRTFAERVDSNAQQLAALVENLLDFSRLERGLNVLGEQEQLDLGETVGRILDRHPDVAARHTVTRQTTPGLMVRGTDQAVERVLTNLVGNAGKYSPTGTTIGVQVREWGGRVEMLVDDEGAGVPAADREQIFSRFFRGRGDAVVNTRGAGLGLAIVREFAGTMGGLVSVTAAPSGGARFVVSYPFADAEQSSQGESDVAS
jgi:signal transduction histidine kinase